MLTQAQNETFRQQGYLVVRGLYDGAAVGAEAPGRHMVYYEDSVVEGAGRLVSWPEAPTDTKIENFVPSTTVLKC